MNNLQLRQKIASGKGVPNLPKQVQRLIQAFNKEDLDYPELATIIAEHPTIAARLIALANSAWAAPATPVNSLDRACVNLGLAVVRSVSIGLALISPFNTLACPAFDIRRFWISSKLVADGAVLLASTMPNSLPPALIQTLHTGGLIHNLGLICLADLMPKEIQQVFVNLHETPDLPVSDALQQSIQTDFCEVGGLFADLWGLPADLTAIIKFHRNTRYQGPYREYIILVGAAADMVSALTKNQAESPPLDTAEVLGISETDQKQVFKTLQPMFLQTTELAKALF